MLYWEKRTAGKMGVPRVAKKGLKTVALLERELVRATVVWTAE